MNIKELKEKYHITRICKARIHISAEIGCGNRVYRFSDSGPIRLLTHMHEDLFSDPAQLENYAVVHDNEIELFGSFSYWNLCHFPESLEYIVTDTQVDWVRKMRIDFGVINVITKWDSIWTGDPRIDYTIYSLDTGNTLYRGFYGVVPLQARTLIGYNGWRGYVWYAVDPDKKTSCEELYKLVSNFFKIMEKQNANTRLEGQVQT